ncbi:hypothetical protein [Chromobacterium subtsugae]|uniref:hypothetical protein n=1 Tax=Chromobacterium subtsugae TaxID=251747 RepID=UPI000A7C4D1A|nr:hypothetical protein [Chromobacterium subtsugae]
MSICYAVMFLIFPICSLASDSSSQTDNISAYSTLVLAIVAIMQAVLFAWQLILMRKSMKDAAKATMAATKSVELISKLERPWIFLEKIKVVRREGAPVDPSLRNNYFISLRFRNQGRSPAFLSSFKFQFVEKTLLPVIPNFEGCQELGCQSSLAVGKRFETRQVGPATGKDVEYTMIGILVYHDMARVLHRTTFAIDVSPSLPVSSANVNQAYDYMD